MPQANQENHANKLFDHAYRLLAIRSRSRSELNTRLKTKGYDSNQIQSVLDQLEERGYLDDRQFALQRGLALCKNRGWGPSKLRHDLIKHSLSEELIQQVLNQVYSAFPVHKLMRQAVDKRFGAGKLHPTSSPKVRAKVIRLLLSRGFEPQEVYDFCNSSLFPDQECNI